MPKMKIAALFMCLLTLWTTPTSGAEVATPNDTARFLAGLPPAAESPLAALARDASWQRHASYLNAIFEHDERNHLSRIRAFSKAQVNNPHDTMLYMFSGPDALHALAVFPNASTYVLSGLEPVGDIPSLTGLPRGTAHRSLQRLETALGSLLTLSFFKTKDMKSQLRSGPVHGTLPIIYIFLARSGKTIQETSLVSLDRDGNMQDPNEPGLKAAARGVKIVFTDGEGRMQTLYYFSTNLAEDGVKSSGFLAFCAKLGVADSLVKSASYLMHGGSFLTVRSFLLDHSGTIVQDDSGIPLSYFDRKKWQFQPFGRYIGPISLFARFYQPQMAELFRRVRPVRLDFGIGYRWRINESNLLLAERMAERKPDLARP
jgi:hypothetical protein